MKTLIYPFILLLLLASCTRNYDNDNAQPENIFAPDTLFTPTGNVKLDSMLRIATTAPQDTNLAKLYFEIGQNYYNLNDIQKAKDYYRKGNRISENTDWYRGLCLFAQLFSEIYVRQGDADSSILVSERALALAKERMSELDIAIFTVNIGVSYAFYKGWYETAFTYFFEALPIFEKLGDKYRYAHLCDIIGFLYSELKMFDEKQKYQEKALEIYNEKPDDLLRAVMLGNYAATLAKHRKEYDKAEKCLNEALRIFTLLNNKNDISFIYSHFSSIAWLQFDMDKSEMYNRKYFEMIQDGNDVIDYTFALTRFSNIELNRGNFKKSEEYVNEALRVAIEDDLQEVQMDCYKILSVLSILQNDYKSRISYDEKVDSIEVNLSKEKAINSAAEMAAKYETEKKELEIEQQRSVIAHANMQRWLLAAGIVVAVVFLVLLWYMLRLRNRSNRNLAERNNALTEINMTKDKFFSIISHDLKNPAVALLDAMNLLVKNSRSWDTDTLSDYYGELLQSAEVHVELIQHLLNWAKVQSGRIVCRPEKFYLSARLRFDVSQVRGMAEKKGITLTDAIPEDTLVNADSNILATVVRNMLTNAVKFTASGGTVTLSAEPAANGKHVIAVSDTGVGMTKEHISAMFRIDISRSQPGTAGEQGTGLGLIVCKDLLEKHGTTLQVESEKGVGSRFWFVV